MKSQRETIRLSLTPQGVDEASNTIHKWLRAAGIPRRDIVRIRLTMEEVLSSICEHMGGRAQEEVQAEMSLRKRFGEWRIYVRYDGEQFDPTAPKDQEKEEDDWTTRLLASTGFVPSYRRRARRNEIVLRIPTRKSRPELLMLDFISTSFRVPSLHFEVILQADKLDLIDREILRKAM